MRASNIVLSLMLFVTVSRGYVPNLSRKRNFVSKVNQSFPIKPFQIRRRSTGLDVQGGAMTQKPGGISPVMTWFAVAFSGILAASFTPFGQSLIESASTVLMDIFQSYQSVMLTRPVETKAATGAVLAVLGDGLAQSRLPGAYSQRRAVSFAAFDSANRIFQHGALPTVVSVCRGNLVAKFFSMFTAISAGSNWTHFFAALESTLAYQFIIIPIVYYPLFFAITGFVQGLTVKETIQRAKENFLPCWKKSIMIWIPIQLIMFGFVGQNWQVPYLCVMGILWSAVLSISAGHAKKKL